MQKILLFLMILLSSCSSNQSIIDYIKPGFIKIEGRLYIAKSNTPSLHGDTYMFCYDAINGNSICYFVSIIDRY
jgi:hypothetical protein